MVSKIMFGDSTVPLMPQLMVSGQLESRRNPVPLEVQH